MVTQWAFGCLVVGCHLILGTSSHLVGKPSQPLGSPPICTTPQTLSNCSALRWCILQLQEYILVRSSRVVSVFVCGPKALCHSVGQPQSVTRSHILPLSFLLSTLKVSSSDLLRLGKSRADAMYTFPQLRGKTSVNHHPHVLHILPFSQLFFALTRSSVYFTSAVLNKSSQNSKSMKSKCLN